MPDTAQPASFSVRLTAMAHFFQALMDSMARWGCVAILFAAPTSRALFNLSAAAIVLGWVLSGCYGPRIRMMVRNPIGLPALLMAGLIVVGSGYTVAPWADVWDHWERYSKFLLVPLMVSLLDDDQWRRRAWQAFVVAMLITLASTYANVWLDLPWSKTQNKGFGADHSVFANHIAQGLVMSFFVAVAVVRSQQSARAGWRLFWAIVAIFAIFSITHLSQGRAGQLALPIVLFVLAVVMVPSRWRLTALVIVASAIALLVYSSSVLQERFDLVFEQINTYEFKSDYTSVGARLHMWKTSIDLIFASPFVGHGTGAYHSLAEKAFNDPVMCDIGCFHPHNQLLFFGVDYGLVGIALFVFYLSRPIRFAWGSKDTEAVLLLSFMSVFAVDIMVHGALWIHMEAYFFFSMLALLMSRATMKRQIGLPSLERGLP